MRLLSELHFQLGLVFVGHPHSSPYFLERNGSLIKDYYNSQLDAFIHM